MDIEVTNKADQHFEARIVDEIRKYNAAFSKGTVEQLSVYVRNADSELVGGLSGATFGSWLHIDLLWVSANERGNGIGSRMLLDAEQEAKKRGCTGATLDTYSFQALDFYIKQGYSQFGVLQGYAGKYKRHYLEKCLT